MYGVLGIAKCVSDEQLMNSKPVVWMQFNKIYLNIEMRTHFRMRVSAWSKNVFCLWLFNDFRSQLLFSSLFAVMCRQWNELKMCCYMIMSSQGYQMYTRLEFQFGIDFPTFQVRSTPLRNSTFIWNGFVFIWFSSRISYCATICGSNWTHQRRLFQN